MSDTFKMLTRFEGAKCDLRRGLNLLVEVFSAGEGKRREENFGFVLTALEGCQDRLEACFDEMWKAHVAAKKGGAS